MIQIFSVNRAASKHRADVNGVCTENGSAFNPKQTVCRRPARLWQCRVYITNTPPVVPEAGTCC